MSCREGKWWEVGAEEGVSSIPIRRPKPISGIPDSRSEGRRLQKGQRRDILIKGRSTQRVQAKRFKGVP